VSTAAIKRFWNRVVGLGCLVHGHGCEPEICHVIGKPSVTERTKEPKPRGKKLPRHDWLVIPLCPALHRLDNDSLDLNAKAFEAEHGPVADMVDRIAARLGVPVWDLANKGRKS